MELETSDNITAGTGSITALQSILDINYAESFKTLMLQLIEQKTDIILDAEKVERITTPCIQIILSTLLSIQSSQISFKIINVNDVVTSSFESLGLGQYLNTISGQ